MYANELFEQSKPRVVVTYPGRFQPFHQGHAGVFAQLQKKFGNENVFILTSNDTSSAKSPFNFSDKYQLMTAAGVPGNHIRETNAMYALPTDFDPYNTIFITAVGAPDADRLNPDSYLKRDKKDKDGNVIKPAGSPGYYRTWGGVEKPMTADEHGYVIVIPEIHKDVTIDGQKYDVSHGTECRNLWNQVRNNPKTKSEFLSQLYGRPDKHLADIFDKIPQAVNEDVTPTDSNYSASPIHGQRVFHEFAFDDEDDKDERPKFLPWNEFIGDLKAILGDHFSVTEKVIKSTIQDRFIPHDPMEYGPTMLYSYYEARAGRGKGAVSTRGSIQVGKYYPNNTALGTRNFITQFSLLKGHPFERHFDLTGENVQKIADIIIGNTQGAYQMPQQQGVAEGDVVHFPKKHKGDLSDTHDCPKCGGDLQGGKYMGHAVKVCMPCKQVYLPPNSGIDQKGNPIKEMDGNGAGRDGSNRKSHSTYGSRDKHNVSNGPDIHLGPKNMMTSREMQDRALDALKKTMSKPENMAVLKRLKTKEGVAESNQAERKITRTQALIQDYYNRARASKNDIKRDHYIDMARQLEYELEGMVNDANQAEQDGYDNVKEDASGVIATKAQAKDPRYSMSLTKDVRPGQVEKNLRAFRLAEDSVTKEDMKAMVKDFLPVAMKELGVKSLPNIVLQAHVESHDGQATFGRFDNEEEKVYLGIANRHPVDILRTLAHELVHFKQHEDGKLYPGAGETGSPIENEAHWVAGIIMRHFNKKYPNAIKSKPLELEESVIGNKLKQFKESSTMTIEEKYAFVLNEEYSEEELAENFADGKNPQDKGDSKRLGVPTKSSVSNLRKVAKQGGRKGQLAHWMANMKAGKAKK